MWVYHFLFAFDKVNDAVIDSTSLAGQSPLFSGNGDVLAGETKCPDICIWDIPLPEFCNVIRFPLPFCVIHGFIGSPCVFVIFTITDALMPSRLQPQPESTDTGA